MKTVRSRRDRQLYTVGSPQISAGVGILAPAGSRVTNCSPRAQERRQVSLHSTPAGLRYEHSISHIVDTSSHLALAPTRSHGQRNKHQTRDLSCFETSILTLTPATALSATRTSHKTVTHRSAFACWLTSTASGSDCSLALCKSR